MLSIRSEKAVCAVAVGLTLCALVAPTAQADLSDPIFEIVACRGGTCFGVASFPASAGGWNGNTYTWTLSDDTPILDPNGELLAILTTEQTSVMYNTDPQVNLSFSVVAGSTDTEFWIKSALLSFPTIGAPVARASAAFTLTDGDEDGAVLAPLGTGSYMAQYNGFVPDGTTFCELVSALVAEPDGTANLAEDFPGGGNWLSLGTSAYDMSSQVHFMLTANDLGSGTSNFEIIPEPAALLGLAAGALLMRRPR